MNNEIEYQEYLRKIWQGWQSVGKRSAHYFQSGDAFSICGRMHRITDVEYFESEWSSFLCQNCWHKLQESKKESPVKTENSEQLSLF